MFGSWIALIITIGGDCTAHPLPTPPRGASSGRGSWRPVSGLRRARETADPMDLLSLTARGIASWGRAIDGRRKRKPLRERVGGWNRANRSGKIRTETQNTVCDCGFFLSTRSARRAERSWSRPLRDHHREQKPPVPTSPPRAGRAVSRRLCQASFFSEPAKPENSDPALLVPIATKGDFPGGLLKLNVWV